MLEAGGLEALRTVERTAQRLLDIGVGVRRVAVQPSADKRQHTPQTVEADRRGIPVDVRVVGSL